MEGSHSTDFRFDIEVGAVGSWRDRCAAGKPTRSDCAAGRSTPPEGSRADLVRIVKLFIQQADNTGQRFALHELQAGAAAGGDMGHLVGIAQLLKDGSLLFADTCRHTAEEFQSYVWDAAAADRGEDRPVKEHDHCMDAIRYFVATVIDRGRGRVTRRPRGL